LKWIEEVCKEKIWVDVGDGDDSTSMMPMLPEMESPIRWRQVARPRQGVTIAKGYKNYEFALREKLTLVTSVDRLS
jgi:hypothetical protein